MLYLNIHRTWSKQAFPQHAAVPRAPPQVFKRPVPGTVRPTWKPPSAEYLNPPEPPAPPRVSSITATGSAVPINENLKCKMQGSKNCPVWKYTTGNTLKICWRLYSLSVRLYNSLSLIFSAHQSTLQLTRFLFLANKNWDIVLYNLIYHRYLF